MKYKEFTIENQVVICYICYTSKPTDININHKTVIVINMGNETSDKTLYH